MSNELFAATLEAVNTGVTQLINSPAYIGTRSTAELHRLMSLIRHELAKREPAISPAANAAAQCEMLRQQFGNDGQKNFPDLNAGQIEVAPDLTVDVKAFTPAFNLVKTEEGHWVFCFDNSDIAIAALMSMQQHLQNSGVSGYRVGDVYHFYVDTPEDPHAEVFFRNRSLNKTFKLNTTFEAFNQWYIKTAETCKQKHNAAIVTAALTSSN